MISHENQNQSKIVPTSKGNNNPTDDKTLNLKGLLKHDKKSEARQIFGKS